MAQWLGLCTFAAKGSGSILGQRIKILQDMQHGQERKKKGTIHFVISFKEKESENTHTHI